MIAIYAKLIEGSPTNLEMNWTKNGSGFRLTVPCKTHLSFSQYDIHVIKRPEYCDRGDWMIWVEGQNDLDSADGFPRYFLGSEAEVKEQMERWLQKRQAYRDWMAENINAQINTMYRNFQLARQGPSCRMKYKIGERVLATPVTGPVGGHEFVGRIDSYRNDHYVVIDQDDDAFELEEHEIAELT